MRCSRRPRVNFLYIGAFGKLNEALQARFPPVLKLVTTVYVKDIIYKKIM